MEQGALAEEISGVPFVFDAVLGDDADCAGVDEVLVGSKG